MAKSAKESRSKVLIERVPTGIPGLDDLLEGGFVKGSTILVTGGTGAGKTTFCAQFIWEGLKRGEPGVYITLEEDPEDIKKDMMVFGFDLEKYEKSGMFKLVYQNPFEVSDISSNVVDVINSVDAKRVVLDPISLIGMYMKDPAVLRKRIFEIVRLLKKTGATILVTSEIEEESKGLSRFGVIEFIVDGVIVLSYMNIGSESFGSLEVRKMRRTAHRHGLYPLSIHKNGIRVNPEESLTEIR